MNAPKQRAEAQGPAGPVWRYPERMSDQIGFRITPAMRKELNMRRGDVPLGRFVRNLVLAGLDRPAEATTMAEPTVVVEVTDATS